MIVALPVGSFAIHMDFAKVVLGDATHTCKRGNAAAKPSVPMLMYEWTRTSKSAVLGHAVRSVPGKKCYERCTKQTWNVARKPRRSSCAPGKTKNTHSKAPKDNRTGWANAVPALFLIFVKFRTIPV